MAGDPGLHIGRGGVGTTTTGALGTSDLRGAAEVIASGARDLASRWSRRVPGSISVSVDGRVATITADAPPAYPNEVKGVRHPVYGSRARELRAIAEGKGHGRGWTWVTNQWRPFLAPAADAKADQAMLRYAQKIDRMARAAGFE